LNEFHDPYVDQRTGVLRNLLGATSQSALDAAESDLTYARATQLRKRSIPRTNDLAELCAIHSHLFQDVYDWAEQTRTVDIRKNSDGAAFFAPVTMIERLALHYDQFNYLHPFREGNGRTQRIFWSRVVRDAVISARSSRCSTRWSRRCPEPHPTGVRTSTRLPAPSKVWKRS
jgi:cell filamentation protein